MSRASAIYARIHMSETACNRWLSSPIRQITDYDDWRTMNAVMASNYDDWLLSFEKLDYMSVQEFINLVGDQSRQMCYAYDEAPNALFLADVEHARTMMHLAIGFAVLRGAENFKDDDEPSFAYAFPAVSGGDPEALLRIERGHSRFLSVFDDAPDTLYFISEAEDFIEALMEDEEE